MKKTIECGAKAPQKAAKSKTAPVLKVKTGVKTTAIGKNEAVEQLESNLHRFQSAIYTKKKGDERKITFRGVKTKNGEYAKANKLGQIRVYDMFAKGVRTINLAEMSALNSAGKSLKVG